MAMVMPAPRSRLLKGLEVSFFRVSSSFPPAIFSRLEDIMCIPNRKNARPPHRVNTENMSIDVTSSFYHGKGYQSNVKRISVLM